QEVKDACQSFLDRGRETYGDYHMLSLDGAELTGLSHQVEDIAWDAKMDYDKVRNYVRQADSKPDDLPEKVSAGVSLKESGHPGSEAKPEPEPDKPRQGFFRRLFGKR
ncbi:MAG: hypothetical protein IJU99_04280, partial [Lachnospiraceae bacterium]|nr:hypothetical protein [Lachnospiraceae bacterium]